MDVNWKGIDMNNFENLSNVRKTERGSATIIAILVLGLLTTFVALAVSRTSSEAMVMSNDSAEGRAYTAAEASLETMTRNFNKVFDIKLAPTATDLNNIQVASVPGFTGSGYEFNQIIRQTETPQQVVLSGGTYQGLNATRDAWRLQTTTTDTTTGVQVAMMREFYNNRIPIFQFGIFYDDDIELFNPPPFKFGGRVHTNRNLFITPDGNSIYFNSRISAVGEFATYTRRNWDSTSDNGQYLYIKNASGSYVSVTKTMGSVLSTSAGASDNVFTNGTLLPNIPTDSTQPPSKANPNWPTYKAQLDNNVLTHVKPLELPITNSYSEIELVRRGRQIGDLYKSATGLAAITTATADNPDVAGEKFANKFGIRITLADSKAKLPGCAAGTSSTDLNPVTGQCGVRLDGAADGLGGNPLSPATDRGYLPKLMTDGYQATRLNGERFYIPGREVWIKVELVSLNTTTALPQTVDITEDFLSLGVTEQAPKITVSGVDKFAIALPYNHTPLTGTDSRSIIKLQRFVIPGVSIPKSSTAYMSTFNWNGTDYNLVRRNTGAVSISPTGTCVGAPNCTNDDVFAPPMPMPSPTPVHNEAFHLKLAKVDVSSSSSPPNATVVPFPIQMFDTREGLYYDNTSNAPTGGQINVNGVMSIIDIDVANMKRFLDGSFNGKFPVTTPFALSRAGIALSSVDVPNANGWVIYVSDRRGDFDFDGEYDMEDIYTSSANNDNTLQTPEDVNLDGILNTDFTNEAVRYNAAVMPDYAASTDHKYYRRAVRLINGQALPGIYDSVAPANTKGFTVSSENGIYVKGNYNATGVASYPSNDPTPYSDYLPQNTSAHIPASIVADSVTVLSNAWNDTKSFAYPYSKSSRVATETTVRFAMIAGDTMSGQQGTPNQGAYSRLAGGVHNFKRFLETWTGVNLNYTGSLINLYNSRNNNGSFKCCNTVYSPPTRNWVFDTTFTDPNRLPPGTPFFQYIEMTGFMRLNN